MVKVFFNHRILFINRLYVLYVTEEFECGTKTGYFADPVECTKYYWCVAGQKYHMPCPGGTHFEGGTCKFGEC